MCSRIDCLGSGSHGGYGYACPAIMVDYRCLWWIFGVSSIYPGKKGGFSVSVLFTLEKRAGHR